MNIDEIADIAGGVGRLAKAAGVHWSTVCSWKRTKDRLVPVHRARAVSEALGIPLHLIRPDVWAPPPARRRPAKNQPVACSA
jgi:hypothetical protein